MGLGCQDGTQPLGIFCQTESRSKNEFALDSPHLLEVRLGFVRRNRLVIALPRHASAWL